MFRSIRHKLTAITVLAVIACASVVFLLSIREHEELYRQSVQENLEAMSLNMADDLLRVISEDEDLFALTAELLSLDRYQHIKFVNVFNADWNLIQQYVHPTYLNKENFIAELKSVDVSQLSFEVTVANEGLVSLKPIGEKEFPEGYLLVVHDYEEPLSQSKRSLFFSAAPWAFLAIFAAVSASFWINRRLLAPLLKLSHFTRHVEHTGDYGLKIEVDGDDEVSQLSHDINSLLHTIDEEGQLNEEYTQKLVQQQESMQRLANYDTLTGLPNRMFFMELLKKELQRSRRENEDLAIMFFDIDGFKDINDRLGHETGDLLLQDVCRIVQNCLREGDVLARLGGDEFLIMIPKLFDPVLAVNIADRIIKRLEKPLRINGWDVQTGISIGIAKAKEVDFDLNAFISNADIAMYSSKEKGKGRYTVFNKNMLEENRRKVKIANLISHAIAISEFSLHYQIKISADGKVNGLEALLRWTNSELGYISPVEFIPIAEQGGKIKAITEWVIAQVFSDMQELRSICGDDVIVSLNISSHDLQDRSLIKYINEKLQKHEVKIENVQIEITESSYLVNFDNANDFFSAIQKLGGSIALDDFGTGYSSLSYLTRIQIDTLKIDREFVTSLDSSSRDIVVLNTILDLGKRIGLKICCEGVETADQAKYLIEQGCHQMQGYYFAKPVPIKQLSNAVTVASEQFSHL
ncbi:MAG: EAL domain-containing protein [Cellvibrionaceae bacterium]